MVDTPATSESVTQPSNGWSDELAEALDRFRLGGCVVVLAESDDGSATRLVERIPADITVHADVVAARASKARVGAVVDELRLDDLGSGEAIVVEEAQWADPTSLGRLERLVAEGSKAVLLMISHRPLSEVDAWWLTEFSEEAGRHARLVEVKLEPSEKVTPGSELDKRGADLVIATRLVTGPISVPVAADLLGMTAEEVLELGEALAQQGWIRQERGGFACVADATGFVPGDVRTGYVADKLAGVMQERQAGPAVVGGLRLAAGQPDEAFPLLFDAAAEAERRHNTGEAFHLAEDALSAGAGIGTTDDERLGQLHLICGRFLRSAGRTDWARTHLERATAYLEGVARVDALGFAAAVADDSQHPQEAERITAVAEWEATRIGETAKVGSLSTLRARTLNRIGFAEEADSVLAKGRALLDLGSSQHQRFNATFNKAWIHFDRGEATAAEAEFTHLRDEAAQLEGDVSVADKEAWRARALFASGHPGQAVDAIRYVEEVSARHDVEAPLFLAQLALVEGGLSYGRYELALEASERALDLVRRQLPAWENMARSYRAEALMRLGRFDEAREEIEKAIAVSPPGSDGWRWRIRCLALKMEIATGSGGRWDAREAEDLADLMLQSRFYHWAADLLCAIAIHGKRKSAASEAMAIAVRTGRPMTAARAASIGSLWGDAAAGPVINAIRSIESDIPPDWEIEWRELDWVIEGLEAPPPADDAETVAATAALDEALRKAGLAGDEMVLSPAQRRSRGLVRRPRVLRPLQWLAAALGVVVLAGGTALAVVSLNPDEAPPTTTSPPVAQQTTVPPPPPSLEETRIDVSGDVVMFAGVAEHRGGPARTGVVEAQGPRGVDGYYWKFAADSPVQTTPLATGQNVIFASRDGTVYAINMTTGDRAWPDLPPEGTIATAPALGQADFGEGPLRPMLIIGDNDGVVRSYRADSGEFQWRAELPGTRIRSSPVVAEGYVYVATTTGFVHGFELIGEGDVIGTFPAEGEGIGLVEADLAYSDGYLYVGTDEGLLHVLQVSGGDMIEVCSVDVGATIRVAPIVAEGVVYVATMGQQILTYTEGTCEGPAEDRDLFYFAEAPMDVGSAVSDGVVYIPAGRFMNARRLSSSATAGSSGDDLFLWPPSAVTGEVKITGDPVVAGETLYFGDQEGTLFAVDRMTGDELWRWKTNGAISAAPAVIDGVVFVASEDGTVSAVGQGQPSQGDG